MSWTCQMQELRALLGLGGSRGQAVLRGLLSQTMCRMRLSLAANCKGHLNVRYSRRHAPMTSCLRMPVVGEVKLLYLLTQLLPCDCAACGKQAQS